MTVRLFRLIAVLLMPLSSVLAQQDANDLAFGQVYGSVAFLNSDLSGTMAEAPSTVLVISTADGHRSLALTQQTGDYIALLELGRYCIAAYTRAGKRLELARNQLKCIDVHPGKDVRLDVMLVRARK